jgi:hypothetical protein
MKQALHIFQKDIRYLRLELAVFLLLCALYVGAAGTGWPGAIVAVAGAYIIARLIHAEAIPGDRQFWLTRPYRRDSLCGAKFLFLGCCICLPILLAQTALIFRLGFPLMQELPGLLCTQALLLGAALPVIALAATTTGIAMFIVSAGVIAVILLIALDAHILQVPGSVDWIGAFALGTLVSAVSAVIVWWQYRDRRTARSRTVGISVFLAATAAYFFLPPRWPLELETRFSQHPELASAAHVTVDLDKRRDPAQETWAGIGTMNAERVMQISLPLIVSGLPDKTESVVDYVSASLVWSDRAWSPTTRPGASLRAPVKGKTTVDALIPVDLALYKSRRYMPLTIRGSLYLTLFGDPESRAFALGHQPANVQDGLQCFAMQFDVASESLICRSLFRWPDRLVRIQAHGDRISDIGMRDVSYSPFPVNLDTQLLNFKWGEPVIADSAAIVTKKPLVHFRRDFEIAGIRLADFEKKVFRWSPIDDAPPPYGHP